MEDTTALAQDPPVDNKPTDQMNDSAAAAATNGGSGMNDDEGAINESTTSSAGGGNYNPTGLGTGIRPIFLGNLSHSALSSDVEHVFRNPVSRGSYGEEKEEGMASEIAPFDLDRVVSTLKLWKHVLMYFILFNMLACFGKMLTLIFDTIFFYIIYTHRI